jgi:hypothetical protein
MASLSAHAGTGTNSKDLGLGTGLGLAMPFRHTSLLHLYPNFVFVSRPLLLLPSPPPLPLGPVTTALAFNPARPPPPSTIAQRPCTPLRVCRAASCKSGLFVRGRGRGPPGPAPRTGRCILCASTSTQQLCHPAPRFSRLPTTATLLAPPSLKINHILPARCFLSMYPDRKADLQPCR